MDLSTLSDADLQAVASGDMSKVSDEGLAILAGKPKPKPGIAEALGAGIAGGVANAGLGFGQAVAHYTGNEDTANALKAKRDAITAWQQQHGGDSLTGTVGNIMGGSAPALGIGAVGTALAPATAGLSLVAAEVANAGLFGLPAFNDEFQKQKALGASDAVAATHAAWEAGLATVGARVVSSGGKLLPGVAKAGEGLLAKTAISGAEGAAIPVVGQVGQKAIDTASGQQNNENWLPSGKEVAASALGFGALGGAHHLMEAPGIARQKAIDDKAKADADAVKAQQKADFEAQQAAAKQTPEYLRDLDTRYQAFLNEANASKEAIGPKPDKNADPSAFVAWQAAQKARGEKYASPEYADLTNEHAERRPEIDALKAQDAAKAAQDAQAKQTAMEVGTDQPTASDPADTRATPLDPNAQPDMFAEGQTSPSGAKPEEQPPMAVEEWLRQQHQAFTVNEQKINQLRDGITEAHAKGDTGTIIKLSEQANQLAAENEKIQKAAPLHLLNKPAPPMADNAAALAKLQASLAKAVEEGDTAQTLKLATKIQALEPQQSVASAPAQNQARDAGIADEMATGREQAAATTAKVGAETDALQRMGEKAKEPSEAQAIAAQDAKAAQARQQNRAKLGLPTPTLQEESRAAPKAQEDIEGTAQTWGELSDQQLQGRVDAIGEKIVNPDAAAIEQQIRELKREQAQHKSIGREDLAAEVQTKIAALESRLRINPHDADTVSKVDDLHRQLEKATAEVEHAKVTKNREASEAAALRAKQIADQLAQVQKEPGSFAGRLIKAKNDVSHYMTAFFDAAHELHTSNMVPALREKMNDARLGLQRLTEAHNTRLEQDAARKRAGLPEHKDPVTRGELERFAKQREEYKRQIDMLDRQLGTLSAETPHKQLRIAARKAIDRYVRAAFREENIRREARQQKPLTGAERAAFAKQAVKHAEDLLTRVSAERGGDYLEEHVVHPAQMRSGQVVKSAVTEWRDTRPLEERPLAKFGPARAVEEEAFHNERGAIQAGANAGKRVETGVLKRQWPQVEAKREADERGDNAKTIAGQQRRRAEYLTNMLHAADRANPDLNATLKPLFDALEESPTTGVMDVVEPMAREALTGRMPTGGERVRGTSVDKALFGGERVYLRNAELNRLKEALALAREVRTGDETAVKQRNLFDPQVAQQEQGRIEDKQAANEGRADEINRATYKTIEDADVALKERGALSEDNEKLEKERKNSKSDEQALKGEAERMATSYERTTPARFANAPEVKAGRAAAEEQAKLVADIHDQLQEIAKADAEPSLFSKLSKKLSTLREQIADFRSARPFAGLKGLMEGLSHRYASMEPKTLLKDGKEVPNPKYDAERQAEIQAELDRYNKFVDDTSKFIAERSGTDTPEYKALVTQMEEITAAIRALPTDPELAQARKLVEKQTKALNNLLAMPEPKNSANRAARQKNIENTRDAMRMAQAILRLKETTSIDLTAPARKAALADKAQQATQQRAATAAEIAKRNEDMDAAVEERMRLDEAAQRLAKLPATVVTRDSGITDAIRTGLNREASGIRAKLDLINQMRADPDYEAKAEQAIKAAIEAKKPAMLIAKMKNRLADAKSLDKSDEGLRKWEKLLDNSERNLQQLEDVAPRRITQRGEPTSEKDDIIPIEPLNKDVANAGKMDAEKLPMKFTTDADNNVSKRGKTKDVTDAVEAAEALNDKQVAGGRGMVTRKIGAGQGKVGVDRKKASVTAKTAIDAGVYASAEKRAKEIDAKLADIARLRELNDEKMQQAIENEDDAAIAKHTAFNDRFDKATAKLKAEYAPLEKILNKGVKRGAKLADTASHAVETAEGDAPDVAELQAHDVDTSARIEDPNVAANKPGAERTSTPLSDDAVAAVKENRLPDALHDIARTSADPEAREAATRLAPFVDRTDVGVERFTIRGETAAAAYIPEENRIAVHPEALTEQEILHESAHAATDGVMLADPAKLNPEQRKARAGLEGMWNSTKNNPALQGEHATTSAREFVAEVYTNPEFRAKLDAIGKPLSLLERFKNFVRQMFGFPTSPSGKARDMVDKILTRSDKIKGEAAPSIFRKKEYGSEAAKFGRDISQSRNVVQDVKAAGWKKIALAIEQKIVDARAALRYTAKIGDNHTGTQVLGDVLSADHALLNGMAAMTNGGFKLEKDSKGLTMMRANGKTNAKEVIARIGELPGAGSAEEKMDLFQGYMTALRARDVGWHTLDYDNPAEMQRRGEAAIKEVQSDPALLAAMNKAQDTYHEYNKELVQFLKDTNAVPDDVADKMMKDRNYIPMFRNRGDTLEMVMQNGKSMSVGDVRTLPFLHALNGGATKLMPFEESLLRNTTMLTNLGVQNMTARHIAYHLQGIGATAKTMQIKRGDGGAARGGTTIRFRDKPQNAQDDGERHIVIDTKGTAAEHIPNDLLAQAVAGSYASTPALLNVGKYASDILRSGVTRMPTYMVSQLFKDPFNAAVMGNLKADPFSATLKTMDNMRQHLSGKSSEAAMMESMGILHSNVFNGTPDDVRKMLMHLGGSNQGWYRNAMSKLDNIAMGADAATRIQGYRDVIKAGGSELEAAIHAQEMQNFSKHGSSQSMQIISRMVPFFNAQVQGLNVLLKSATGKMPADQILETKQKFFKRALGMTAISLAYAAALDDDPEWRKLTLRSQMANIKVGDMHVPAPFETGMLFYSLPVAFIHALKQNFNENDWKDVSSIIQNQLPGNGSIVPQFAKGALDVTRNYNSSFGTPIETRAMDKKDTTEKFAANTPEMMKAFSRHLVDTGVNLSPVQLDYLANAYLGQLPHMVGMATNHLFETKSAAHDGGEPATGTAHDNPLLSRFVSNPKESRNVNDAYTRANKAMLTDATIKSMKTDGRAAQADTYRKDQLAQYGTPQQARAFQNQMGFMKRQEEAINLNKSLDGPGKQKKLEELYKRRDAMAANYLKIVDSRQPA